MDGLASFAAFGRFLYFIHMVIFFVVTGVFCFVMYSLIRTKKKKWPMIIIIAICYIVFLGHHFWYQGVEELVRKVQGSYYYYTGQYEKSADAYLDIQYDDGVYDKLERTYNTAVEKFYKDGEYRRCINFIDKINDRYYSSRDNYFWTPWYKNTGDYILKSYVGLYNEYKKENKRQELIDLINEINKRYNYDEKIINKENGFDFEEDFTNYEKFEFVNENSTVFFGKIGVSSAGLNYNKIARGWRLLYKEDNKAYLLCSTILISRYMNEKEVNELKYEKTDMFSFLNDYLYNEMFDEKEKKALIPFSENENISLLSEDIINKMLDDGKGKYLNVLLSRIPISYLVDAKNGGSYQKIWIKSDIESGKAKYVVESSNEGPRVSTTDANKNDINVLPIICVDLNILSEYAKEERAEYNETKNEEEQKIENEKIEIKKQSNLYDMVFKEKINAMQAVTEYPDEATIDDFDTLIVGDLKSNSMQEDMPIAWILLEKTENKALLLSKYSLDNGYYDDNIEYSDEPKRFNFKNRNYYDLEYFSEDEARHIVDTKIVVSKNDSFPDNNDLDEMDAKLFFLSIDEVKKYFVDKDGNVLKNKLKTLCDQVGDDYSNELGWWLRDIGELWWTVAYIDKDGNLNERGMVASNHLMGQRLAMWVDY